MWLFLLGICGVLFKFISSFFFFSSLPQRSSFSVERVSVVCPVGVFFLVWRFQGWATLNGEEIPAESGKA